MGSLALALALGLGPQSAGRWALWAVGGNSEHGDRINRISRRESRDNPLVGVHVLDAWLSGASWRGQVRLGHLDPDCQPYGPAGRWATHGPWGLNASDHWAYLPECYQPEILDIVLVSALVAARKFRKRCEGVREHAGWCR